MITAPTPAATAAAVTGPIEIPMELFASRPLMRATVGAAGSLALLFDPLALTNTIDGTIPETLKIKPAPVTSMFDFDIGFEAVKLSHVAFIGGDTGGVVPEIGREYRPRGVVGLSIWRDQLVTIDYSHWRIRIEPGRLADVDNQQIFAFDAATSQLRVPLYIGEYTIPCRIDPMYPGSLILPASYVLDLPIEGKPSGVTYIQTRDMSLPVREAQLATSATLASVELPKPTVLFGEIGPTAVAGYQALAGLTITYDVAGGRARIAR